MNQKNIQAQPLEILLILGTKKQQKKSTKAHQPPASQYLVQGAHFFVRLATSPLFRHIRDSIRCVAAQPRTPSSLYCKQSAEHLTVNQMVTFCIKKSLALLYKRLWLSQLGSNQ